MASIAEDRLRESVIADFSIEENFLLGLHRFKKFSNPWRIFRKTLRSALSNVIQRFEIKAPNPLLPLRTLSGGNQQKIVVARELEKAPKLLLAAQPTRGVDVGAVEFIHSQIRNLQASGTAVLLISSELSELLALSTRILVFYKGRIVDEFNPETCTERELGLAMGGANTGSENASP
jgi:simple sugar transport system ATP-binding protein